MIEVLGIKRIIILAVLFAINAAFAGAYYGYMQPEKYKQERVLAGIKRDIPKLRQDIDKLRVEFSQLEGQKERFGDIQERGFFNTQGRDDAEKLLNRIQQQSGVIKATASIGAGDFVKNEFADRANHRVLTSPLEVIIEATDDIDIYRYLYILKNVFPGQVVVKEVLMKRDIEVTAPVLRNIAAGGSPPLVQANITMEWSTLLPKEPGEEEG